MRLKVYGFSWLAPNNTPLQNFLEDLERQNIVEVQSLNDIAEELNYHRIVAVTRLEEQIWGGFLLTVKNARRFVQTQRVGAGNFRVSTAMIEDPNQKFSDINFFIVNSANGNGLYEYYHLSAEPSTFNSDIVGRFLLYANLHQVRGRLRCSSYLTPDDFEERMQSLQKIHNIEYEFTTLQIQRNAMVPAPAYLNRRSLKVFVAPRYQEGDGVKAALGEFVRTQQENLKRFRVKGLDGTGENVYYSLFNDPSIFRESEFDDFNVDLTINDQIVDSLRNCENLRQLLNLSNEPGVRGFFRAAVN